MFGHMGGKETEGGSSGFRSLKGDWAISEKIVTACARHAFHRSVRSNIGIQRLAVCVPYGKDEVALGQR